MLCLPDLPVIYDRYLTFTRISRERYGESLARKLIFVNCFDGRGVATVVAATIAGAATLCVDDDAGRLREGLRTGLCDFVVGNLDEAVRILKNEVRRGLAVSVGLMLNEEACIAAMAERGVQPDLLAIEGERYRDAAGVFRDRGAIELPEDEAPDSGFALLMWSVASEPARSLPRIAELAAAAFDPARPDTAARRNWLTRAPRTLGRAFGSRQCSRMAAAEVGSFLDRIRSEFPEAVVTRDGESIQPPADK